MANKFTHKPTNLEGSIPYEKWVEKYAATAIYGGDTKISVVDKDGKKFLLPVCAVALLFKNPKRVRGSEHAVEYTPLLDRVPLLDGYRARGGVVDDNRIPMVGDACVVLPLGKVQDENARALLQQAAREWLSEGKNDLNCNDENVINMYMHAIAKIAFLVSNCKVLDEQKEWFITLCLLAEAIDAYRQKYPLVHQIITAIKETELVDDMLQHALSYIFFHEEMQPEELWRMMEVTLKRATKYNVKRIIEQPSGMIALFILRPLLKKYLLKQLTLEKVQEKFNKFIRKLTETVSAALIDQKIANNDIEFDLTILLRIMKRNPVIDIKENDYESVRKFLKFCRETYNYTKIAPLEQWGIIKKAKLMGFKLYSDKFTIKGSKAADVTITPLLTVQDIQDAKDGRPSASKAKVVSKNPTQWAAVGLSKGGEKNQNGIYTVAVAPVGVASGAVGSSRGEELKANYRITSGTDILPSKKEGFSSAGMFYSEGPRKWDYIQKFPLSLEFPLQIHIDTEQIQLYQENKKIMSLIRAPYDTVLFAFKNLKSEITYEPFPEPPPIGPAGRPEEKGEEGEEEKKKKKKKRKDRNGSEGLDHKHKEKTHEDVINELEKNNLTQVALLEQLTEIATKKKKQKKG